MAGPPVPFSSLPLVRTADTHLNAWGAYGADDELGFLNRQTPALVAAAARSEIQTGVRVALDAPLDVFSPPAAAAAAAGHDPAKPLFGRQAFVKHVYQKRPRIVHDDVWTLNTQSSSQWDGLRHFGYQRAARFYNDVTVEDIAGDGTKDGGGANVLGIQNAVRRGGITGRGILVDFARWAATPEGRRAVGGDFNHFQTTEIKLEWLLAALAHQNDTRVRFGDILFVRSGWFPAYRALTDAQLAALQAASPPTLAGVEQSEPVLAWIWDNFSAVVSDHPSFEAWPPSSNRRGHDWSLHEVLLAGWGCHIGELFDLDELSSECARQGRWSFFVSSVPCHVPGGVASPPNAVAIF